MDGDTEPKIDDFDNGWVLDSEQIREEKDSEIVLELWQHCSVICQNVSILIIVFLPHPNFLYQSSNIANWARGSNSVKMTWYKMFLLVSYMEGGPG